MFNFGYSKLASFSIKMASKNRKADEDILAAMLDNLLALKPNADLKIEIKVYSKETEEQGS